MFECGSIALATPIIRFSVVITPSLGTSYGVDPTCTRARLISAAAACLLRLFPDFLTKKRLSSSFFFSAEAMAIRFSVLAAELCPGRDVNNYFFDVFRL